MRSQQGRQRCRRRVYFEINQQAKLALQFRIIAEPRHHLMKVELWIELVGGILKPRQTLGRRLWVQLFVGEILVALAIVEKVELHKSKLLRRHPGRRVVGRNNFAAFAISKQRIELFFKRPSLAAQRIVPGVAQRAQVVQQIVEAKIILVAFAGFQMRQDRRRLLAGGGVETFQITHYAGNRKRSNNALAGIRKLVGADEGARFENGGPEIVVRFVGDDFRF